MKPVVAIVTPAFAPAEAYGGPVTAIVNRASLLQERGCRVIVYTTDVIDPTKPRLRSNLPRHEVYSGVTVRRYHPILWVAGYWITPALIKDLMHDRISQIVAECARSFQLDAAALVSVIRRIPLIVVPHGSLYSYGSIEGGLRRWLYVFHNAFLKASFRRARRVVATSSEEQNQFTRFGISSSKMVVTPNFLDANQFSQLPEAAGFRERFGIAPDQKIILFLGRLNEIKGLDILIMAFIQIFQKRRDTWLVLVGPDSGYLKIIQGFLERSKCSSRIVVTGALYGSAKIEALAAADFLVVPSRYESFGIVVLEAFFCGKPVVASNIGGLRDLVADRETGFLFRVGDVDQLANLVEELLNKPEERQRMGENARQFALDHYSARAVGDMVMSIYSPLDRDWKNGET